MLLFWLWLLLCASQASSSSGRFPSFFPLYFETSPDRPVPPTALLPGRLLWAFYQGFLDKECAERRRAVRPRERQRERAMERAPNPHRNQKRIFIMNVRPWQELCT